MVAFDLLSISEEFKVMVESQETEYSVELVDEVERVWGLAVTKNPSLFNGKIFCYKSHSEQSLRGQFFEYKYFYACVAEKDLKQELNLIPVGITGVTQCGGKTLIGKRSKMVTLFSEKFEFVPAGCIDPGAAEKEEIDLQKQFLMEIEEEADISPSSVEFIEPFLLVYDKSDDLFEIFAKIQLHSHARKLSQKSSQEYSELFWLDDDSLQAHYDRHMYEYVPTSKYLLAERWQS